jgi:hypothetical protein
MLQAYNLGYTAIQDGVGDGVTTNLGYTFANPTANVTYSPYAVINSSTPWDSYGLLTDLFSWSTNTSYEYRDVYQIATGASGSEVTLIPDLLGDNTLYFGSQGLISTHYWPIFIPAGTRLSYRMKTTKYNTSQNDGNLRVKFFRNPPTPYEWIGSGITVYGYDDANLRGTQFTSGASNSWGSWTQITASTTRPHREMSFVLARNTDTVTDANRRYIVQFGIGSAGSEHVISPLIFCDTQTWGAWGWTSGNRITVKYNIPAGSRISIRGMCSTTSPETFTAACYGVS